jgi:NAD+ kinase
MPQSESVPPRRRDRTADRALPREPLRPTGWSAEARTDDYARAKEDRTSDFPLRRVALVAHPTRDIDDALGTLRRWTADAGIDLVGLTTDGGRPDLAPPADAAAKGDLIVALGGDGTLLASLRAAADAPAPVLGVACGSLGALSAVAAEDLAPALDRFAAGDWTPRALPALAVASEAGRDQAVNDVAIVRGGPGQVATDLAVDGERYARLAGDGVIVATPAGSSAYSMAAGGAVLPIGTPAFLCTPLAMHGGSAPPLVVPGDATLTIDVEPGFAGFELEIDGRRRTPNARSFRFTLELGRLTLVRFSDVGRGLTALRRRGLISDSPRILARDRRAGR